MNLKIKEVNLGKKGLEYVSYALAQGGPLSNVITKTIDVMSGQAVTFLSEPLNEELLFKFEWGGKFLDGPPIRRRDILEIVFDELLNLSTQSNSFAISENRIAAPTDNLGVYKSTLIFHGVDAFHMAVKSEIFLSDLCQVIFDAEQIYPPLVVAILRCDTETPKYELLHDIVDGLKPIYIDALLTNAYDGESYVLWKPSSIS